MTINSLAPPPQLAYASLEQARAAVNAHAQQEGYAVAIRHTRRIGNKKDGDVKAIDLDCSRANPPAIRTGPRQRMSSSLSTGCLFKASIRRLKAGDWQVQVVHGEHNHEPFVHKSVHPRGRALTEENKQLVLNLIRAGVKPNQIVTSLRQNSNVTVTAQDIRNLRNQERNRMLADRHVEAAPVGIEMALKRIADDYDNAPNHRKRVLLDHALAVPEASNRSVMQVQASGRPTGSTQRLLSQFQHVAAALEFPVRRRQCRICQQTGHNARTCRRQAPGPAAATPATATTVGFRITGLTIKHL